MWRSEGGVGSCENSRGTSLGRGSNEVKIYDSADQGYKQVLSKLLKTLEYLYPKDGSASIYVQVIIIFKNS